VQQLFDTPDLVADSRSHRGRLTCCWTAWRTDSSSSRSEPMRTLLSSTFSRTTRRSLVRLSMTSFWSANALRIALFWSSRRVFTALIDSLSVPSRFWRIWHTG